VLSKIFIFFSKAGFAEGEWKAQSEIACCEYIAFAPSVHAWVV
jgi:hypothetical protein